MKYRIYEENGEVAIQPLGQISIRTAFYPVADYLTAEVIDTDYVDIRITGESVIYKNLLCTDIVGKDGTTPYGTSGSAVVSVLNELFGQKNFNDFIVKDNSADNSGTTKFIHKASTDNNERGYAGTVELGLHTASLGLYGSQIEITETDLANTNGASSAYGELRVFLENAGTPVEVLEMIMTNQVQAPNITLNANTLDINNGGLLDISGDVTFSGVNDTVTFSGSTSGIDYNDLSNLPAGGGSSTILDGAQYEEKMYTTTWGANANEGNIVRWGIATNDVVANKLYYFTSFKTWAEADADAESTMQGMLAYSIGTSSSTDGMLLQGFIARTDFANWTVGARVYISTTGGGLTTTAPGAGKMVRVVGYVANSTASYGTIYFNPSNEYVKLAP